MPWWPAELARGKPQGPGRAIIERDDFAEERRRGGNGSPRGARCGSPAGTSCAARGGARRNRRGQRGPQHDPALSAAASGGSGGDDPLGARDALGAGERAALRPTLRGRAVGRGARLSSPANPRSLVVAEGARWSRRSRRPRRAPLRLQGHFFVDPLDSRPGAPAFNRTISLKDTWARQAVSSEARGAGKKDARATARARRPPARRRRAPRPGGAAPSSVPRPAPRARSSPRGTRAIPGRSRSEDDADLLSSDASLAAYSTPRSRSTRARALWRAGS